MSLQKAAKYLESKGRNGDSMLVHMTPGEVKGLQALAMAHGGSLSVNPHTGLAEASFLKNILPMIAGAALTPFIGPYGAALAVGGEEALRTGDLGTGVMRGLGALGGANLMTSLSAAAPAAVSNAVTSSAPSQLATLTEQNLAMGLTPAESTAQILGASNVPATSQYATLMNQNAALDMTPAESMAQLKGASTNVFPTTPPPTTYSNMAAGAKNLYNTPDGITNFLGNNKMNLALSAAPVVSDAMTPKTVDMGGKDTLDEKYKRSPYAYNLSPNFQGYVPTTPNPYYRPTGLGYAQGGEVGFQDMPNGGLAALQQARDGYGAAMTAGGDVAQFAAGGSLGGYSDGGRMLKGPGDGMSDSIPGVIGSKQPARLADGEFVVPADVVSHLGNGSTDAGAKRLYGMMDKVRKARTGTKKQGKQIKPEKYMPT